MDILSQKYRIKVEILTPTSIGIGGDADWVEGLDYVLVNNTLYHLRLRKLAELELVDRLVLLQNQAEKSKAAITIIGQNRLGKVSDFQVKWNSETKNGTVRPCLRNQLTLNPLLAGSSLKGAITSALIPSLKGNVEIKGNGDMKRIWGDSTKGTDFRRFIKVGDFEFERNSTEIINTKIFNLRTEGTNAQDVNAHWTGGWKHGNNTTETFSQTGFNTIYECFGIGAAAEGSIVLASSFFDWIGTLLKEDKNKIEVPDYSRKKKIFHNQEHPKWTPWHVLCYAINNHTVDYLNKELTFFETFNQGAYVDKILDSGQKLYDITNDLLEDPTSNNSCVLKMSVGSGFHSITGDWQYDDYTEEDKLGMGKYGGDLPKSRKIAFRGGEPMLMGFVKLTLI